jgi:DNA-directed RNA polymerase specialized sigma24 family protein
VVLTPEHRRALARVRRNREAVLDQQARTIVAAHRAGASLREIAEVVGVSKSTVDRILDDADGLDDR